MVKLTTHGKSRNREYQLQIVKASDLNKNNLIWYTWWYCHYTVQSWYTSCKIFFFWVVILMQKLQY